MARSQRMWMREHERLKRARQRRARRRRNCAIVVVLAVIIIAVIAIIKGCSSDIKTVDNSNNEAEIELASQQPQEDVASMPYTSDIDISDVNISFFDNSAFVGNSLADSIKMYNLLPDTDFYTSVNLDVYNVYTTVTGYGTTSAADQLKSKKFKKIFLSFGEREIADNDSQDFIDSYKELIEKIKSYRSNTQIYLISIPPSSKTASSEKLYGMSLNTIKKYNKLIKNMASEEGVFYVDSFAALSTGRGYLPDGVSSDGINLNRDCCTELLDYITNKAYVPDASDLAEDEDSDKDDEEDVDKAADDADATEKPTAAATASPSSPEPTVNVLKDSAISQTDGD